MPFAAVKEIEAPEFFKFAATGDSVEGKIVRREMMSIRDKKTRIVKQVPAYFIERGDGSIVKFLAGADLAEKLIAVPLKSHVDICYAKDAPTQNGTMKVYQVRAAFWVDGQSSDADETFITDADLPEGF
jgi:hypothetical protein